MILPKSLNQGIHIDSIFEIKALTIIERKLRRIKEPFVKHNFVKNTRSWKEIHIVHGGRESNTLSRIFCYRSHFKSCFNKEKCRERVKEKKKERKESIVFKFGFEMNLKLISLSLVISVNYVISCYFL